MIAIILFASKFKINPDNVATPIAASLGDVVTLGILSYVGTFFYEFRKSSNAFHASHSSRFFQPSCIDLYHLY